MEILNLSLKKAKPCKKSSEKLFTTDVCEHILGGYSMCTTSLFGGIDVI